VTGRHDPCQAFAGADDIDRLTRGNPIETPSGTGSQFVQPDPPAGVPRRHCGSPRRDRSDSPVTDGHNPGYQLAPADNIECLPCRNAL
jgi:hypothetical protein